jgi:outer membrane protein assembly factor BamB
MQNNNWNKFQENVRNDDCDKWFGSVVLTADGELFVGCYGEDFNAGYVYHYAPSSDVGLFEMRQKITALDRSANDIFGNLRQLAVDGNVMVVGADGSGNVDGSGNGQVYIYARDYPSASWMEVTQILAPYGEGKVRLHSVTICQQVVGGCL